jgi:hypothetical protein
MFLKPGDPRIDKGLVLSKESNNHYVAFSGEGIRKPHVETFQVAGLNVGEFDAG